MRYLFTPHALSLPEGKHRLACTSEAGGTDIHWKINPWNYLVDGKFSMKNPPKNLMDVRGDVILQPSVKLVPLSEINQLNAGEELKSMFR